METEALSGRVREELAEEEVNGTELGLSVPMGPEEAWGASVGDMGD